MEQVKKWLVRKPNQADREFTDPLDAARYVVRQSGPVKVFAPDGSLILTKGTSAPSN